MILEGDRVRYNYDAQRRYRRQGNYTGLVAEVDRHEAYVIWNGGERGEWESTADLEVMS
jgi:hypothetical protein